MVADWPSQLQHHSPPEIATMAAELMMGTDAGVASDCWCGCRRVVDDGGDGLCCTG